MHRLSVSNENKLCKKSAEMPKKKKHPTQSHAISFCLDSITNFNLTEVYSNRASAKSISLREHVYL